MDRIRAFLYAKGKSKTWDDWERQDTRKLKFGDRMKHVLSNKV